MSSCHADLIRRLKMGARADGETVRQGVSPTLSMLVFSQVESHFRFAEMIYFG